MSKASSSCWLFFALMVLAVSAKSKIKRIKTHVVNDCPLKPATSSKFCEENICIEDIRNISIILENSLQKYVNRIKTIMRTTAKLTEKVAKIAPDMLMMGFGGGVQKYIDRTAEKLSSTIGSLLEDMLSITGDFTEFSQLVIEAAGEAVNQTKPIVDKTL
ncbi:unnamed protein product [Caenorhabditis bovis]|uniref:SXP/RAL-2 family protein Ani s 5-like cation-binding domain-containing protein n=1 Tax=Caenorhabditis bovis TaxID=2654633 RepID=A0A8S1ESV8_9PELO|nr:unnamed protein product [Caenorhabditis bovis]